MEDSDQLNQSALSQTSHEGTHNEKSRRRKSGGKPVLIILVILLILALLAGGVWYLLREPDVEVDTTSNTLSTPAVARATSTPTVTPTPVEIEREEITIEVLNGTGIAGEASFLQGELENLGYENIEVGNASSQDNETTLVVFSSETPESVIEELTTKLKELYEEVETDTSSSQSSNVSITTGLRSGQTLPTDTPKAAATSTPTPTESDSLTPTPTN